MPEAVINSVEIEKSEGKDTFYTVYNSETDECVGDDFTAAGALDTIAQLNREDDTDAWTYYANENATVLDSMASLVQDHLNHTSGLGGQG